MDKRDIKIDELSEQVKVLTQLVEKLVKGQSASNSADQDIVSKPNPEEQLSKYSKSVGSGFEKIKELTVELEKKYSDDAIFEKVNDFEKIQIRGEIFKV